LSIVEDLIAEMLNGRDALIQLEAFILANRQYGNLTKDDAQMLLEETDKARRAVQDGLRLGRLVRSPPPDLEGLVRIVEEWNEERSPGRQAKRPSNYE
jgi:hypothetical protein